MFEINYCVCKINIAKVFTQIKKFDNCIFILLSFRVLAK